MIHDYSYWRPRPTSNDFELEVISKHPDFNGRPLKKYAIDGINTVGCWGEEPFEIHFHNRSTEDAQVRISLDGTDVLTAKPASLELNHDMWVVRAGRTLHLRAWAETNKGGARFVFTGADKSVALHAHGDISHKGIISAAVFTEKNPPRRVHHYGTLETKGMQTNSGMRGSMSRRAVGSSAFLGDKLGSSLAAPKGGSSVVPAAAPDCVGSPTPISETNDGGATGYGTLYGSLDREISESTTKSKSLKKEAAVGAGEYVAQPTTTVKGLEEPILNSIVRVRYMWWDDLQARLKDLRFEDPHPTGFPAEKIKTFADLSNVPRVNSVANSAEDAFTRTESRGSTTQAPVRTTPVFDRVI